MEFEIDSITFHYFRTHFSEDRCWLQLVVKEGNQFYKIFSWKGKGNQKERFLKLFNALTRQIEKWRTALIPSTLLMNTKIVSKEEFTLIGPFTARLKALNDKQKGSSNFSGPLQQMANKPICIEDISIINYDHYFEHFKISKTSRVKTN